MKEKLGYELYHSAKLATRGCRLGQRHSDNRGREKQGNVGIYVVVEQIDNRYLESKLGKASKGSLLMTLDSINDWEQSGKCPIGLHALQYQERGKEHKLNPIVS